jgi:hypothetical protein
METFMADFSLDDLGAIEFKEFGEETNVFIRKHLPKACLFTRDRCS